MSTLALEPRAAYDITSPLSPVDRMAAGFLSGFDGATLHAYTDDLMHYFDWCRLEVHLDPMTAERPHLELYVRWMQRHPNRWAEQTIARRIGTVCSMYHIAKRDRLITENPGEFVKRPKVDREKQHRTVLSVLELAKLMQYVFAHGTPTERAYLALLGYRGLRVSEACGLDVTDYYEERGYRMIRFVGKGSKARVVSIPPPAQAHIEAAIAGRDSGPILLNQWGNRMTRQNGCVLAKRLATDAGLTPQVAASIANHTFRRTFITTGRQMGIPLDDLSKTVGHANLTTTQIYDRRDDRFRDKSYEIAGHLAQLAS